MPIRKVNGSNSPSYHKIRKNKRSPGAHHTHQSESLPVCPAQYTGIHLKISGNRIFPHMICIFMPGFPHLKPDETGPETPCSSLDMLRVDTPDFFSMFSKIIDLDTVIKKLSVCRIRRNKKSKFGLFRNISFSLILCSIFVRKYSF